MDKAKRVLTSVAQTAMNVHEAQRRSFWDIRERIDVNVERCELLKASEFVGYLSTELWIGIEVQGN